MTSVVRVIRGWGRRGKVNDREKFFLLVIGAAFVALMLYVVGWVLESTCLDVPKQLC